jgi:hypothetical protein
VFDTIAGMTAASLVNCDLDARERMIAGVPALVAADAPPLAYLSNARSASDMGITIKDVQKHPRGGRSDRWHRPRRKRRRQHQQALGFAIAVAETNRTPNPDPHGEVAAPRVRLEHQEPPVPLRQERSDRYMSRISQTTPVQFPVR